MTAVHLVTGRVRLANGMEWHPTSGCSAGELAERWAEWEQRGWTDPHGILPVVEGAVFAVNDRTRSRVSVGRPMSLPAALEMMATLAATPEPRLPARDPGAPTGRPSWLTRLRR